MKEGSVKRGKLSWLDKRRANQQRIPKIVGILISILFHVFGIWYLLTQLPVEFQSPAQGSMGAVSITLAPAPRSTPKPTVKTPPAKPKTAPAPTKPRRTPPKVAQERMPVTPEAPRTIVTPQPDAPKYAQSVQEDFSTQLQARREQREAAQAQERAMAGEDSPSEEAPQSPNDIAKANIQAQRGWMGIDKAKNGGIFEVRDKTPFRANLVFHGWSTDNNRNATQYIPVERGSEISIEAAIVNKMIDMIRKKTQTDIPWRSQRLGRVITLSARLKDTEELQQFLMREMFYQDSAPPR
ncbi:hypothetical protein [Collimonas pratensis]|uniref:Uncharacterized protein n=1 Tax=Collimonas pratensis TaxID=279113 RepID=A0ABN4MC18_9BURK|nr:hypothetical protein [Collimonas pratensis]AMP15403.1 hypothetical protein CPter291_3166 [Collimonas pratensis]